MSLEVEDGSIVADANSYVSVVDATAYAALRGVTLPAAEADVEILLIKAMDWLESMRSSYQGTKYTAGQALQWPRENVCVDGFEVAVTTIPQELINAQCQVAMDLFAGLDPQANSTGQTITRRKVDVIETEYADPTVASQVPYLRKAMALLSPLLSSGNGSLPILRT